jgi:hypothetical protein
MISIGSVLELHGIEIRQQYEEQVPDALKPIFDRVELENNGYSIGVTWVFSGGSTLPGPAIDIDTLAYEYPDCDVVY